MQWILNKDHGIYRPIKHNNNTLVIVEIYCVGTEQCRSAWHHVDELLFY